MADIFLSYRRDDSGGHAGRLYDYLSQRFGAERVFMDIDAIPLGVDFNAEIDRVLRRCAVVLVIIGRRWVESMSQWRQTDYLKAEIIAALGRGAAIRVVPVLVDGATLPDPFRLPTELRPLLDRHAFHISDRSFAHDAKKLIDSISRVVKSRAPAGRTPKLPRATAGAAGSAKGASAKGKARNKSAADVPAQASRPAKRGAVKAEAERTTGGRRPASRKKPSAGKEPVVVKPPRNKTVKGKPPAGPRPQKTSSGKSPGGDGTGSAARPRPNGSGGKASASRRSASGTPAKPAAKSKPGGKPVGGGAKTPARKPAATGPRKKR